MLDKKDDLQQEKFFVYHELLTEFDEEFRDCLTDMAEDISKKQGCMFISSLAKSCEVEAAVKAKTDSLYRMRWDAKKRMRVKSACS